MANLRSSLRAGLLLAALVIQGSAEQTCSRSGEGCSAEGDASVFLQGVAEITQEEVQKVQEVQDGKAPVAMLVEEKVEVSQTGSQKETEEADEEGEEGEEDEASEDDEEGEEGEEDEESDEAEHEDEDEEENEEETLDEDEEFKGDSEDDDLDDLDDDDEDSENDEQINAEAADLKLVEEQDKIEQARQQEWRALETPCRASIHETLKLVQNNVLPNFYKCQQDCKESVCRNACKKTSLEHAQSVFDLSETCKTTCKKKVLLSELAPTDDEALDEDELEVLNWQREELEVEIEEPEPEEESADSSVLLQSSTLVSVEAIEHLQEQQPITKFTKDEKSTVEAAEGEEPEVAASWWNNKDCKKCIRKHWKEVKANMKPLFLTCKNACNKGDSTCTGTCHSEFKQKANVEFDSKCGTACPNLLLSEVKLVEVPHEDELDDDEAEGAVLLEELMNAAEEEPEDAEQVLLEDEEVAASDEGSEATEEGEGEADGEEEQDEEGDEAEENEEDDEEDEDEDEEEDEEQSEEDEQPEEQDAEEAK